MSYNYLATILLCLLILNCKNTTIEKVAPEPYDTVVDEPSKAPKQDVEYTFDEVSALGFAIGDYIEPNSNFKFSSSENEYSDEGETWKVPKTVVSDDDGVLIDLLHAQDHRTENYVEIVDEIIIHTEKLKNKEGIGVGSTVEDFFKTYPFAKIYYSYIQDYLTLDNGIPGYQFHLKFDKKYIDGVNIDSDLIEINQNIFTGQEEITSIRIFGERGQVDFSGQWFTKDKEEHATIQKKNGAWHIELIVGKEIYQQFSQKLIVKNNMLFSDPATDNQIQVKPAEGEAIIVRLDDHPEFEPLVLTLYPDKTEEKPINIASEGLVKNFTEERGRIFVEVDFVELVEIENGWKIKNDNPKTWVYELTRETYQDCREKQPSAYDIWAQWEKFDGGKRLYWIKIENNFITEFYLQDCAG